MKSKFFAAAAGSAATLSIIAPLFFVFPVKAGSAPTLMAPGNIVLAVGPPANHHSIIFNATWKSQVEHAENDPVDCLAEVAATSSQCVAVIPVDAPAGATHAYLKVKAKGWVTNAKSDGGKNHALIYARAPIDGYVANHFIHCEAFGGGSDGQEERRRVCYADVMVPIVNGTVTLQVGKKVIGKSIVEMAVYLTGYISSPQDEAAYASQ